MANNPVLNVKNLSVFFREKDAAHVTAVDTLSFEVSQGAFFSLVGASGSGKTATALSVPRLLKSDQTLGQIFFHPKEGASVDLLSLPERGLRGYRGRKIAMIFQDPGSSLNPVMKVGPQILEAYHAHFRDRKEQGLRRVLDLLRAVLLADPERVYDSFPHELSGGMKQRAMIAMALVTEPELLIADEPTTALDPETSAEVMALIESFRRERSLTVLFITHHMALAAKYSDTILVMQSGKVVELLHKKGGVFAPASDYAKKLFSADLSGLSPKSRIPV